MKIKLILICLLLSSSIFSQKLSPVEQYLFLNKVDYNLEMGKPVSRKNLERVLNSNLVSFLVLRDHGYKLISTNKYKKYKSIGLKMLEKCSAFGIFQEKKLKSLLDSNDYKAVRKYYLDSITPEDIKMSHEAIYRMSRDQYFRRLYGITMFVKKDTALAKIYGKLEEKVDSSNYYEFIAKLLKEGKFPHRRIFNLNLGVQTDVLFLHDASIVFGSDSAKFEQYRKKIYQMVLEGKFSPSSYALWVDRFYVMFLHHNLSLYDRPEIYGTYRGIKTKPDEIPKVYDPKNLNKRRQAIGLMTTEQEIKLRLHRLAEEKENAQKKKSK